MVATAVQSCPGTLLTARANERPQRHPRLSPSTHPMASVALDAARAALDAAGERQKKIDEALAEEGAKLAAMDVARAARGSGRPNQANARAYAAIQRQIDRLQRGILPGEVATDGQAPSSVEGLRASAQNHPQHHAAAGRVPQGRGSSSGTRRGAGDATTTRSSAGAS